MSTKAAESHFGSDTRVRLQRSSHRRWKRIAAWRLHYTIVGLILVAVFLFPVYWMVITSLKPTSEILTYPPHFFPYTIDLSSYELNVLNNQIFLRYLLNSTIVGTG